MPLYEYECSSCGERTEVLQRLDGEPLRACPRCGSAVTKLLSAPALQFKGSGFYLTDYGRGGKGRNGEPPAPAAEKKPEPKETKETAPAAPAAKPAE